MDGPCNAFCTPIPVGVTFGECAMPLGIAQTAEGCVFLSGCSSIGSDGMDYAGYFYDWMEECQAACGSANTQETDKPSWIINNPVNEFIQLSNPISHLTLYNAMGEIVLQSNTIQTPVWHLANGLYLAQITAQGKVSVQRVIVQH